MATLSNGANKLKIVIAGDMLAEVQTLRKIVTEKDAKIQALSEEVSHPSGES